MKKYIRIAFAVFFIVAGINHFLMPGFYYPLIPAWLPWPVMINILAGAVEIILGLGLFSNRYRNFSAWGIVVLMIFFIPSHVCFIQMGSCVEDGLCVHPLVAWIRLLLIHPVLIFMAWYVRK